MDGPTTWAQRAFVNVAGFIYASFGFSLSVIAALFNVMFYHTGAQHDLAITLPSHSKLSAAGHARAARPKRSGRSASERLSRSLSPERKPVSDAQKPQALRSLSEKKIHNRNSLPITSSPLKSVYNVSEANMDEKLPATPSKMRAGHGRRSQSIPTILSEHHDFPEHISWRSPTTLTPEPTQISETNLPITGTQSLLSPPTSAQTSSSSNMSGSVCPFVKAKPRLFDPKTWGNNKRLKRCQSSPSLSEAAGVPFVASPFRKPQKPQSSDSETSSVGHGLMKTKSWKPLRKAKSGPVDDKSTPKAERKADKKRSQTLRTHPYEAPYFAPPPVPSLPVHITFITDHTSSADSSPKSSLDRKSSHSLRTKFKS